MRIAPRLMLVAAALALALGPAQAQPHATFPSKPVTLVVPYPPGGSNDTFARALAKELSDGWKVPVLVDNRPGGDGTTGPAYVAHARADGYTLCLLSSSFTTGAAIRRRLPYDPVHAFAPVALVARAPMLLTVSNRLPARTTLELFALARRNPGGLTFGSSGVGSVNHFATELLMDAAQIRMKHAPRKGIVAAVTDTIDGRVDVLIASAPAIYHEVTAGNVRALGVTTAKPSPLLPGLPPLAEMGVPGYHFELWWGVLAPAATPRDVVDAINAQVNRAVAMPAMRAVLEQERAEPTAVSPERFAALIRDEITAWRTVAKASGFRPE